MARSNLPLASLVLATAACATPPPPPPAPPRTPEPPPSAPATVALPARAVVPPLEVGGAARCPGLYATFALGGALPPPPPYKGPPLAE